MNLISDEMLHTFAVVSETPQELAATLKQRYGDIIDSWECTLITEDQHAMSELVANLR